MPKRYELRVLVCIITEKNQQPKYIKGIQVVYHVNPLLFHLEATYERFSQRNLYETSGRIWRIHWDIFIAICGDNCRMNPWNLFRKFFWKGIPEGIFVGIPKHFLSTLRKNFSRDLHVWSSFYWRHFGRNSWKKSYSPRFFTKKWIKG